MGCELVAVTFDARAPDRLAPFWAGMLGRVLVEDARGVLLPGSQTQVGVRLVPSASVKDGPNPVHLHLTSTGDVQQQETVQAALALGGLHLDVGQVPEDGHVVLGDPEGNELCVIEPHNAYLDGCGLLGEVACDGTRQVGLFWAAALGWPLVWDQDEETAIQSPRGGTKLAWGGPPLMARHGRNRQRFDLAVRDGDAAAEVQRLVSLGATPVSGLEVEQVELADPDGNEFSLTRG